MTDLLRVSFCCNDQHGRFAHEFDALEVYDGEDHCLSIYSTSERKTKMTIVRTGVVRIGRRHYPYSSILHHEGSLLWTAFTMPRGDVELLIRQLHAAKWDITEWQTRRWGLS